MYYATILHETKKCDMLFATYSIYNRNEDRLWKFEQCKVKVPSLTFTSDEVSLLLR